ncbi:Chaperonin Cpn60 [Artemisia annua]|uniref:Chaperonin Cpn60 n=1 Tax=Artemisia annua TaxID=35608 RepID=A0A2U1Q572_ARTAN|nr:Chaperonin Cpn60 [Artemisia annua]
MYHLYPPNLIHIRSSQDLLPPFVSHTSRISITPDYGDKGYGGFRPKKKVTMGLNRFDVEDKLRAVEPMLLGFVSPLVVIFDQCGTYYPKAQTIVKRIYHFTFSQANIGRAKSLGTGACTQTRACRSTFHENNRVVLETVYIRFLGHYRRKLTDLHFEQELGQDFDRDVGAQTQVELKDKQLRMEDAVNATKATFEEGVVVGGRCCLLRLSLKVNEIKKLMDNEEQKLIRHLHFHIPSCTDIRLSLFYIFTF